MISNNYSTILLEKVCHFNSDKEIRCLSTQRHLKLEKNHHHKMVILLVCFLLQI